MNLSFRRGLKDGVPVCLGYFFVSFGFGILAVKSGLSAWAAGVISATNLTSAGQVAGVGIIAASGTLMEMALTQLLINCRYALMGLALSQNLSGEFTRFHRMTVSFGITDEIFGIAAASKEPVRPVYMYGLIVISFGGWVGGTILGALFGELFPPILTAAFGILLYGMFIAIVIPTIRESVSNLLLIILAAGISTIIYYFLPMVTSGFAIIISAVAAAGLMAILFPVKEPEGRKTEVPLGEEKQAASFEEGIPVVDGEEEGSR